MNIKYCSYIFTLILISQIFNLSADENVDVNIHSFYFFEDINRSMRVSIASDEKQEKRRIFHQMNHQKMINLKKL